MSDERDPLRGPVLDIHSATCDLCGRDGVTEKTVRNEANGLTVVASLCEVHLDTLERYNRDDDVSWKAPQ